MTPESIPNNKYSVPMSLWLVEHNHFKIKLLAVFKKNDMREIQKSF
jgi:hypothetical protein